tara:strand:+ start:105208 stop:106671 length:1464 start_codon:yes stop_codon:yes gene_type:complete
MTKSVGIIGAGISGLAAACKAAQRGFKVTVLEQHAEVGGRARSFEKEGFTFDKGPSWYWMPDVFERFFNQFDEDINDYLDLKRLDPSYQVIFTDSQHNIPANFEDLKALFESLEDGAGKQLEAFMADAEYKYRKGMDSLVYKPGLSILEFAQWDVISALFKLQLLGSFTTLTEKYFTNPKILEILNFPVLFLGAKPKDTPALYSLMNYADIKLGTWYPMGGMCEISEAFHQLALKLGVEFRFNCTVEKILVEGKEAKGIQCSLGDLKFDNVISAADYHFTEQKLLQEKHRNYNQAYWDSRVMSPSSLLFYVGVNKKLPNLEHHNLFFDTSFEAHAHTIYDEPSWPEKPLFYVCAPSKTDASVAPEGKENLFFLVPIAPGINEISEKEQIAYFKHLVQRVENKIGESFMDEVAFCLPYSVSNFEEEYNSFKGNAYGLANTLKQTAFLKPRMKNKALKNVFYCGQLSVPGPGLPPAVISGQIVAELLTA